MSTLINMNNPLNFLSIPPEMCQRVYEMYFAELRITVKREAWAPLYHNPPTTTSHRLSILEVSKTVKEEATVQLCRLALVHFSRQRSIQIMLSRVGIFNFCLVRKIELSTNEEMYRMLDTPANLTNFFPHLEAVVFSYPRERCSMRPRTVVDSFAPPAFLRESGLIERFSLRIITRTYMLTIVRAPRTFEVYLRVPLMNYSHSATIVKCERDGVTVTTDTILNPVTHTNTIATEEEFMARNGFWY